MATSNSFPEIRQRKNHSLVSTVAYKLLGNSMLKTLFNISLDYFFIAFLKSFLNFLV